MAANILVVFWSRMGATERLGLTAGLGAVQGRGLIRLRWLKEPSCDHSVPGWSEARAHMEEEYIQPRPIDVEWATGIVLASPPHVGPDAEEWRTFFALNGCRGKRAGLIVGSRIEWESTCSSAGLVVIPSVTAKDAMEVSRLTGRALTE